MTLIKKFYNKFNDEYSNKYEMARKELLRKTPLSDLIDDNEYLYRSLNLEFQITLTEKIYNELELYNIIKDQISYKSENGISINRELQIDEKIPSSKTWNLEKKTIDATKRKVSTNPSFVISLRTEDLNLLGLKAIYDPLEDNHYHALIVHKDYDKNEPILSGSNVAITEDGIAALSDEITNSFYGKTTRIDIVITSINYDFEIINDEEILFKKI